MATWNRRTGITWNTGFGGPRPGYANQADVNWNRVNTDWKWADQNANLLDPWWDYNANPNLTSQNTSVGRGQPYDYTLQAQGAARPYLDNWSSGLGNYGIKGSAQDTAFQRYDPATQFNTVAGALGWQNTGNPYTAFLQQLMGEQSTAWNVQEWLNAHRLQQGQSVDASEPYAQWLAKRYIGGSTAPASEIAQRNQADLQALIDYAKSGADVSQKDAQGREAIDIGDQVGIAASIIGAKMSLAGRQALRSRLTQLSQQYQRDSGNLGGEPNFYKYALHQLGLLPLDQ